MPYGFDLTNSPAKIAARNDIHRPMVLVSSSGTQLLLNADGSQAVYVACFRNVSAIADHLAGRHERVAVLGAGTRGEFRREDQMGCAWIVEKLVQGGYEPATRFTADCVARWKGISPEDVRGGKSAEYLCKTGQVEDLEFILQHFDDLATVPMLSKGELVPAPKTAARSITPPSENVLSELS